MYKFWATTSETERVVWLSTRISTVRSYCWTAITSRCLPSVRPRLSRSCRKLVLCSLTPTTTPVCPGRSLEEHHLIANCKRPVGIGNGISMWVELRKSEKAVKFFYKLVAPDMFELFGKVMHLIPSKA